MRSKHKVNGVEGLAETCRNFLDHGVFFRGFKVVPIASSINGCILEESKENRHLQAPNTNFGDLHQPKGTCKWTMQPIRAQRALTHKLCSNWPRMKNLVNDCQLPCFLSSIYNSRPIRENQTCSPNPSHNMTCF